MQQLTELDYTFVQMESNRTPMHISPVMFYDQSKLKRGKVRFKEILTTFERNLYKSAVFRRKLAGGALGLDTPYWVEDADFDLEFHVRHIALPKPGDWRQLNILLARLHARGLDMRRPLWEAYVIEGLNNVEGLPANSFAIMLKVHHAAIDGVSAAEIIGAIHSVTEEAEPPIVADPWEPESDPTPLAVWSRAYINNLKRPVKLLETAGGMVPRAIRAGRETRGSDRGERGPLYRTRFNGRVTGYRVTDGIILDLARVKKIRQAVPGATVNDVIVSIVGGALRKYLLAKDELPQGSLTCGAPINVRAERSSESIGNEVGMMTISMSTDIDNAIDRLKAVSAHAQQSKAYSSAVGAGAMMDITRGLWPQVTGAAFRLATLAALKTEIPTPVHTVVSNVPGPQEPLYLAGARLQMIMGIGPVLDFMGLFHAVISGAGKITVNFVSCREMLPDPGFYRDCLIAAYEELERAALKKKPSRKRKSRSG